jgi:hypothetical protein
LDRIADALVKAGAPGNPTDYYRIFKENRINGQAVKSLLFGRKIFGVAMSTGKPIEWEWANNGEFKFTMGNFKLWEIAGSREMSFSFNLRRYLAVFHMVGSIYRNPDGSSESKDQYLMVSDIGTMYW